MRAAGRQLLARSPSRGTGRQCQHRPVGDTGRSRRPAGAADETHRPDSDPGPNATGSPDPGHPDGVGKPRRAALTKGQRERGVIATTYGQRCPLTRTHGSLHAATASPAATSCGDTRRQRQPPPRLAPHRAAGSSEQIAQDRLNQRMSTAPVTGICGVVLSHGRPDLGWRGSGQRPR